jgi:hypothetical protein
MMEERTSPVLPAERPSAGTTNNGGDGAQAGPLHLADPRVLTILTTEHWSLLSQRNLAWTESFSRAGMFLATLSAATVALALVGSVMRDGFIVFALVILPVVWFIGEATAVRVAQSNDDDAMAVRGMNRIRHAYLEMVPGLEPYFLTSRYDDMTGILVTSGAPPAVARRITGRPSTSSIVGGVLHGFVTAMGMIMVIVSVVGAVYAGLVAIWLGATDTAAVLAGAVVFLLLIVVHAAWAMRFFRTHGERMEIRFPTPPIDT